MSDVRGPRYHRLRLSEIAQLAERLTVNQHVAGSSPALGAKWTGPLGVPFAYTVTGDGAVAQWLEQGTHNPSVVGSIPTRPTLESEVP